MRDRERERERENEVQIPDNLYPEKPFELRDAQPGIKIGSTAIYRLYIKYRQCIAVPAYPRLSKGTAYVMIRSLWKRAEGGQAKLREHALRYSSNNSAIRVIAQKRSIEVLIQEGCKIVALKDIIGLITRISRALKCGVTDKIIIKIMKYFKKKFGVKAQMEL
ncbi:hypothetical protein HZH68_013287 [Vespula germanica]|uniref:Uncharacterized protein n=1 Tax=Vespula germanica TaxID=30212 RepID=A0A834JDT0_VESGE|nr:hypothetical protein HZH68_013287 [Vespula germanica]